MLSLFQAVDVIRTTNVLDAMRIMAEAGEALIPRLEGTQIAEIWTISCSCTFTRHEHGNARRIGDNSGGDHAVCQAVQRYFLDFIQDKLTIRLTRCH